MLNLAIDLFLMITAVFTSNYVKPVSSVNEYSDSLVDPHTYPFNIYNLDKNRDYKKFLINKLIYNSVINTGDDLQYSFYPIDNGYVAFKVKAQKDVQVALTTGPKGTTPMVQIIIGGWKNRKSVIRLKRTQTQKRESDRNTPKILNRNEYRGFWIRWNSETILVGKAGDEKPFLLLNETLPFAIGFIGFRTDWGARGSWIVENGPTFDTPGVHLGPFTNFIPTISGSLAFEFRGPHDCHVVLTGKPDYINPMYEIIIGGWKNKLSALRYSRELPNKWVAFTPGIVNPDEFRGFSIEWKFGRIHVKNSFGDIFLNWTDPNPFSVTHFGIRTAWKSTGEWRFKTTNEVIE